MHGLSFSLPTLLDPVGGLVHMLTGVLGHFVSSARTAVVDELDRYMFSTVDITRPGGPPLTSSPTLAQLNGGLMLAGDILLVAVIAWASLRSILEHRGLRPHYGLKVVLPRALVAVVLGHGSMWFMQMAIDLNNALGSVARTMGDGLNDSNLPWSATLDPGNVHRIEAAQDLFHAVFAVAIVVALVILAMAYVIRGALLNILIVTAPLAALGMILPETLPHSRSWVRLFVATLFMQPVQLIVLHVAVATAFSADAGIAADLYSLATLWLMLKVPGAMNTSEHLETKAHTLAHNAEKSLRKVLLPHSTVHHKAAA